MIALQNTPLANDELLVDDRYLEAKTGISRRTWQGYRTRGEGPKFVHVSKRCVRYRLSDVTAWIERSLRTSTSDSGA